VLRQDVILGAIQQWAGRERRHARRRRGAGLPWLHARACHLSGIYSAVLYRYAVGNGDAPGFEHPVLESAFRQKS
jgi:hypothetical protein